MKRKLEEPTRKRVLCWLKLHKKGKGRSFFNTLGVKRRTQYRYTADQCSKKDNLAFASKEVLVKLRNETDNSTLKI